MSSSISLLYPNHTFNPLSSSARALLPKYSQNSTRFHCIGFLARLPVSTKDPRWSFISMNQVMPPPSSNLPSGLSFQLEHTVYALSWLQGPMWFDLCLIFFYPCPCSLCSSHSGLHPSLWTCSTCSHSKAVPSAWNGLLALPYRSCALRSLSSNVTSSWVHFQK